MQIRTSLIGALLLALAAPARCAAADTLSARVAVRNGRPTIFLNDRPVSPMVYALTDVPGGRWSWEEVPRHNIRSFYERGIRLFQVDLWLEQLWSEDGLLDISPARRQIAGVTDVCPEAGVIFRFHVTPPKWWMKRHPGEWVKYADTDYEEEDTDGLIRILEEDNYAVRRVSLASELWTKEGGAKLVEFLRALSRTPEGSALAGIQVADGIYGEWHTWGFYRHEPDTGAPMTDAFRAWLTTRYGNDRALQKAWRQATVTLGSAKVPGMEERRTSGGVFRDPERERQAIDFYTCMHELVAGRILHYARLVKETWPRPIVTGTFYGYHFSVFSRQAAGGHLELHRVLTSPFIDYLSGPQAYEPEALKLGEPYRSRSLIASVRLHGKLWLDEMDCEPTVPILRDGKRSLLLRGAIANVRRNLAFTYTKGMGLWFYDFGVGGVDLDGFRHNARGSRGTWDHPAVMREIQELRTLFEQGAGKEYRSEADVLFVYDTESFYHTASLLLSDPVSNVLVDYNSLNAFKSSVVFDPVHIRDLDRIDLSPYRVVVFGNTYLLSEKQREFIRGKVARDGRTLVWFYAPGYTDGQTLDARRIGELTGIGVAPVNVPGVPEITLALTADSTLTYRGAESAVTPLFGVTDPRAEVIGRFTATGEPAVVRKSLKNSTAWYVSLPSRGVELMREILRRSGAHLYAEKGEIVYAGGGLVALHCREGGRHTVTLKSGKALSFDLPEGASTLLLDSTTGELLRPIH